MNYDRDDRKILEVIQGNISLTSHPYRDLAERLNMSEQEVVERITALKNKGMVRRFGAVLRHQKAGFIVNAMVAWRVVADEADKYGMLMAQYHEISHCYLREVPAEFGYNLFTMIHARSEWELTGIVNGIAEHTGLHDYVVYKSLKELKKVSMIYMNNQDDDGNG